MSAILTTVNKVSNFLIREQWRDRNFCRLDGAVLLTSIADSTTGITPSHAGTPLAGFATAEDVVEVGAVVMIDEGTTTQFIAYDETVFGTYTAGKLGILVDERVGDAAMYTAEEGQITPNWGTLSTDVVTLALLVSGDAIIRFGGLSLTDTQKSEEALSGDMVTALEAQGIKVQTQLGAKYSTDLKRGFRSYK